MKKLLVPLISVIANAYFVLAWVYIFNAFETHQERIDAFSKYLPTRFFGDWISVVLIVLSFISIYVIGKSNVKTWVRLSYFLIQGCFLSLLIAQFL